MDEDDPEVFSANTKGTQNVIDACVEVGTLKHAIFTSSLLVCELGYIPSHEEDYCHQISMGKVNEIWRCSFANKAKHYHLLGPSFGLPRFGALGSKCPTTSFSNSISKPLYTYWMEGRHKAKLLHWECTLHYTKDFRIRESARSSTDVLSCRLPTTIRSTMGKQHPKATGPPWPIPTLPMPALYGIATAGTISKSSRV